MLLLDIKVEVWCAASVTSNCTLLLYGQ